MKKNPLAELEKALGYRFKSRRLLEQALVHPSFAHEQKPESPDNQRLEFLGDAALGLAAAAHLYKVLPDAQEGDLTRFRSSLASTNTLHELAQKLNLGLHLKLGRGETMTGGNLRVGNLADALEAVLGAAYLDGGMVAVEKIFKRAFKQRLQEQAESPRADNPKGALQEWLQSHNQPPPQYRILHEKGPPHDRSYEVAVISAGETLGRGKGSSKREAESAAARAALHALAT